MKGTYILIIRLSRARKSQIGKLGKLDFKRGYYAYVGSALNGLKGRIDRHLRKNKKLFWHIDYLLQYTKIIDIFIKSSNKKEECKLANELSKDLKVINHFGSSDCGCLGHLFYNGDYDLLKSFISRLRMRKYH